MRRDPSIKHPSGIASGAVTSHHHAINNSKDGQQQCIIKDLVLTLASAILVVMADKNKPKLAIIALIPVILFLILDVDDLFVVASEGSKIGLLAASLASFSVWPFYSTLLIMLIVAIINPQHADHLAVLG